MSEGGDDFHLQPLDAWVVVDRWWTQTPIHIPWITVRAPNGDVIAIGWNAETKTWTFRNAPTNDE